MSVVVRCLKDRLRLHRDGKGMIEREKAEGGMLLPGWNTFAALVCSFFFDGDCGRVFGPFSICVL